MTREQWDELFNAYRAIWPAAARFTEETPAAWFESGMHKLDYQAAADALVTLAQDSTHAPGLANWIAATHAARAASQPRRVDAVGRAPASRDWVARWRLIHRRVTTTSVDDVVRARFVEWMHEDATTRLAAGVLCEELTELAAKHPPIHVERRKVGEMQT